MLEHMVQPRMLSSNAACFAKRAATPRSPFIFIFTTPIPNPKDPIYNTGLGFRAYVLGA